MQTFYGLDGKIFAIDGYQEQTNNAKISIFPFKNSC